jgi:anthranilate phosphoribosyltransferase
MLFFGKHEPKTETNASSAVFDAMLDGKMDDGEIADYLTGLNKRGFGEDEIYAAATALRKRMTVFKGAEDAVDVCGTGGDRHGTLNVSTAAAFVLAGGGVKVAKHGNRAVSSLSGSSDVLGALGANIDVSPSVMQESFQETNLCYLAAPLYHPAMKHVANARKQLGTRTIFNLLGPLLNPAKVKRQVIGVYDESYLNIFAHILKKLGSTHVWIVHGKDGLDEITTTCATSVAMCDFEGNKEFNVQTLTPTPLGLPQVTLNDLKGGDATHNAKKLKAVLEGEKGPYRDIVLLNTAAGFVVAGKAQDIQAGMKLAAEAIDSGGAAQVLDKFTTITGSAR